VDSGRGEFCEVCRQGGRSGGSGLREKLPYLRRPLAVGSAVVRGSARAQAFKKIVTHAIPLSPGWQKGHNLDGYERVLEW